MDDKSKQDNDEEFLPSNSASPSEASGKRLAPGRSGKDSLPSDLIVTFSFKPRIVRKFLMATAVIGAVFLGATAGFQWIKESAHKEAIRLIDKGYGALAYDKIDWLRWSFTSDTEGCSALVRTYYLARKIDRLQWALESCLSAGIVSADVFLAQGQLYMAYGDVDAAVTALNQAGKRFKSVDALIMKLSIHKRMEEVEKAVDEAAQAILNIPNDPRLTIEAIKTFMWAKRYDLAGDLAALSTHLVKPSGDPTIKDLIIKALQKGGNFELSQKVILGAPIGPSRTTGKKDSIFARSFEARDRFSGAAGIAPQTVNPPAPATAERNLSTGHPAQ